METTVVYWGLYWGIIYKSTKGLAGGNVNIMYIGS